MLKQTVTYTDFDEQEQTEILYFNFSKAELMDLELTTDGTPSFSSRLEAIAERRNGAEVIKQMRELMLMTYGQKSSDGKRFMKSAEIREQFEQTEAFSELLMLLCTDADKAVAFVNGLIPKGLVQQLQKAAEDDAVELPQADAGVPEVAKPYEPTDTRPAWVREDRDPTPLETRTMTHDQLQEAFAKRMRRENPGR